MPYDDASITFARTTNTHNVPSASKCECRHAPKPSLIPYHDANITFTGVPQPIMSRQPVSVNADMPVSCLMMMKASHSQEAPTCNVSSASKCECRHAPQPNLILHDAGVAGIANLYSSATIQYFFFHSNRPAIHVYRSVLLSSFAASFCFLSV